MLRNKRLLESVSLLSFRGQNFTAASFSSASSKLADIPSLKDFMRQRVQEPGQMIQGSQQNQENSGPKVYLESYGCQMNESDSEIVLGILSKEAGYSRTSTIEDANLVLVNTCAIRDNAEQRIWGRLGVFKGLKLANRQQGKEVPVVGVLGCMAERLKTQLLESDRLVDIVAGPDAYRDLPNLINTVRGVPDVPSQPSPSTDRTLSSSQTSTSAAQPSKVKVSRKKAPIQAINVQLSAEETYADIAPVRPSGKVGAFLSIMRGCSNLCSFCIVPFTRGRERSRPMASILDEVRMLADQGVKEITLLGQNVNSYADRAHLGEAQLTEARRGNAKAEDPFEVYAKGFTSVYKPDRRGAVTFAELLLRCSEAAPETRFRFTSPHPKDFNDDVLDVVKSRPNVCKQLHMPAQSGSTRVLERMRRGYTRDSYLALLEKIRRDIPGVAVSTDMIAGFCGETEEDHADSLDLMRRVRYENAFLFHYSKRDKTHAARHYEDDVPEDVKLRRLQELMDVYREGFDASQREEVGRRHLVLIEGPSPKKDSEFIGKTDTFKKVIIPRTPVPVAGTDGASLVDLKVGDYVEVEIKEVKKGVTLLGQPLRRSNIRDFYV